MRDKNKELVERASAELNDISSKYIADQKATKDTDNPLPELRFFYEGSESDDMVGSLKQFLQQVTGTEEELNCRLLIVDIPGQRYYLLAWADTSNDPFAEDPALLANIIEKFKKDELEWKQF